MAFGKRTGISAKQRVADAAAKPRTRPKPVMKVVAEKPGKAPKPRAPAQPMPVAGLRLQEATETKLSEAKISIFNALIDMVDLTELGKLEPDQVRAEITDIVSEIISVRSMVLSATEQQRLISEICDDVLGLGPIEPLLALDDVADIMVNGPKQIYIERGGRIEKTDVTFRDNAQLMHVCQRIVNAVGRRVDESSPICDARLMDGSRVNVIAPPLSIDGTTLTIRKFTKEKLTLAKMVEFGTITPGGAKLLEVIGGSRLNVLISGGTGSGKTTMLNCLTQFIDPSERTITCEDAAELQLQQPHVVRLETRPPNLEGIGEVTMRDLVRNCLRMRPERIIVGEVRGPEAFDLLQAMNTGHDGSMGTVHANNPRDAISRLENMIAMGEYNMPTKAVREQVSSALHVIIQTQRLRDGSRRITHITEVMGMERDVVTMQDLVVYEIQGEDEIGNIIGRHKATGIRPSFWDRARYFGLDELLTDAMEELNVA